MKKRAKNGNSGANGAEVTQSNGEGDHVISNKEREVCMELYT